MTRSVFSSLVLALLALLGCNTPQTTSRRSSLMDYLYPKQQRAPAPTPAGARLKLPLKLGIAFQSLNRKDKNVLVRFLGKIIGECR